MAAVVPYFDDGLVLKSMIDDLVPEHVSHSYPGLMYALKKYAEFLEHINGSGHYLNTINRQRDIDQIEEMLLIQLQKEIGAAIPRQFAADPRLFYKRVSEYYRTRGIPNSIETFFQVLFGDEVEIYFPKDDMLIPSDGKWYDASADTIADVSKFTPLFTYTMASPNLSTVGGNDDTGRKLIYDNPIIFVNGTLNTDWTSTVEVNTTTNTLDYSITFNNDLTDGDVVTFYRSGTFSTNDGFLDNYKKIQDSFFYQKFSYVLRTGVNTEDWKDAFTRLVHPSGFIFFGEILLFLDNLGQTFPLIQPGFQTGGLPFPIIIPVVDASISFVKALDDVIASMVVVQFGSQSELVLGAKNHFESLKFNYTAPLSDLGVYTVEDVINNRVTYNIDSVIEIS